MARGRRDKTGADSRVLSVEGTLLRAALLGRLGHEAGTIAQSLTAVTKLTGARSCLNAGAPLQLTLDAPGPVGLRAGVRLADRLPVERLRGLIEGRSLEHLVRKLTQLPRPAHATFGTWLFWTHSRQSIFVDLRDPDPRDALARLDKVLDATEHDLLRQWSPSPNEARPWALRLEADAERLIRLHVHWLLHRHVTAENVAEKIAPGCWPQVIEVLGYLLGRPGASGRWVIVTPLDRFTQPGLRIGNSAWTLVPEDERKHSGVACLMRGLGGPREYGEALWSLCRGAAGPGWRVGRACEVRVCDDRVRARLFLSPQTQEGATAEMSNSPAGTSLIDSLMAEPSRV